MAQQRNGNMPVRHMVLFILYLLFIWFDGGLCLAMGSAGIGRTASIICCVLLSGVPALLAGELLRRGKTKLPGLLVLLSGVFTVFAGCQLRTGNSKLSIIAANLLIQTVCIGIALFAIAGMQDAKGCRRFLLIVGIICVIVSAWFSMLRFNTIRRMQFVGLSHWMMAFSMNPVEGLLRYQGSLGLLEGGRCSALPLFPMSSAFYILMLRTAVAQMNGSQPCDEERFRHLRQYKAESPVINRTAVGNENYEYLNAYKRKN